MLGLKRPFIWIARFRHRCGYGVHSPFAFSLITDVIYERRPYYAYRVLDEKYRVLSRKWEWATKDTKVNRLLFRLVNRFQPEIILEASRGPEASLYLRTPKPLSIYAFTTTPDFPSFTESRIDFLYLNHYEHPDFVEDTFRWAVERAASGSLFVVRGIGYSEPMKELWRRFQADERVGITFDLYDVGLLFFDRSKIKQHYIVNF